MHRLIWEDPLRHRREADFDHWALDSPREGEFDWALDTSSPDGFMQDDFGLDFPSPFTIDDFDIEMDMDAAPSPPSVTAPDSVPMPAERDPQREAEELRAKILRFKERDASGKKTKTMRLLRLTKRFEETARKLVDETYGYAVHWLEFRGRLEMERLWFEVLTKKYKYFDPETSPFTIALGRFHELIESGSGPSTPLDGTKEQIIGGRLVSLFSAVVNMKLRSLRLKYVYRDPQSPGDSSQMEGSFPDIQPKYALASSREGEFINEPTPFKVFTIEFKTTSPVVSRGTAVAAVRSLNFDLNTILRSTSLLIYDDARVVPGGRPIVMRPLNLDAKRVPVEYFLLSTPQKRRERVALSVDPTDPFWMLKSEFTNFPLHTREGLHFTAMLPYAEVIFAPEGTEKTALVFDVVHYAEIKYTGDGVEVNINHSVEFRLRWVDAVLIDSLREPKVRTPTNRAEYEKKLPKIKNGIDRFYWVMTKFNNPVNRTEMRKEMIRHQVSKLWADRGWLPRLSLKYD